VEGRVQFFDHFLARRDSEQIWHVDSSRFVFLILDIDEPWIFLAECLKDTFGNAILLSIPVCK